METKPSRYSAAGLLQNEFTILTICQGDRKTQEKLRFRLLDSIPSFWWQEKNIKILFALGYIRVLYMNEKNYRLL